MRIFQFMKKCSFCFLLIFKIDLPVLCAVDPSVTAPMDQRCVVDTIFGSIESNSLLISDLLHSNALHRLKFIDQGGPCVYFNHAFPFNRYAHSLGVWALLHRFHCTESEQVAGLLHDASHTAFSHLADVVFDEYGQEHAYQDVHHLDLLARTDIVSILNQHNFLLSDADPECASYICLEKALPDMCADRIEYNIHTGLVYHRLSAQDVQRLVDDLRFDGSSWYFKTIDSAIILGSLSLDFTKDIWGAPWNMVMYDHFKDAIKRAMDIHLMTQDDFLLGTDQIIMDRLRACDDEIIQKKMDLCSRVKSTFSLVGCHDRFDAFFKPKFRGMDPLVEHQGQLHRLSFLSASFKEKYDSVQAWCASGFYVKYAH